ncbi:MAG: transcription antitermination factor NusB [Actinomycetes bacterium]
MSARRKARKRAVDFLYEAEIKKIDPKALLESRPPEELSEGEYAIHLVSGVVENQRKIDDLIMTYAQGWDMDRMPALDRNILRVAIYELLYEPELADQIAINEAVEIAEDISTVDSSGYINGVLGRISALKESLI